MKLTCPHCGFSKEIDPTKIPPAVKKIGCPRCQKVFFLSDGVRPAGSTGNRIPQPGTAVAAPTAKPAPAMARQPVNGSLSANAADTAKAGFWIRVAAIILDSLALGLIQFVLSFILRTTSGPMAEEMDPQRLVIELLIVLAAWIINIVYYVFFTGYCGQTPGKMALGIKVIRTSGMDIGYGRAFLREVIGKFLSGILFGIGYLMVAFDEKKQGLHDRIAGTYVIKL